MADDGSRKHSNWPYMLMAAAGAGLIVAFGLCLAGFRNGSDLQSFATASVFLFIISGAALVVAVIAAITRAFTE